MTKECIHFLDLSNAQAAAAIIFEGCKGKTVLQEKQAGDV